MYHSSPSLTRQLRKRSVFPAVRCCLPLFVGIFVQASVFAQETASPAPTAGPASEQPVAAAPTPAEPAFERQVYEGESFEKQIFRLPDRTVTMLVPAGAKVDRVEKDGFRIVYSNETNIDVTEYRNRRFIDFTVKYAKPRTGSVLVLDMEPFDSQALLHVWNPDDRAAYATVTVETASVDLGSINYKGAELKFVGEVQAIAFGVDINPDQGEHVIEIRKFDVE